VKAENLLAAASGVSSASLAHRCVLSMSGVDVIKECLEAEAADWIRVQSMKLVRQFDNTDLNN